MKKIISLLILLFCFCILSAQTISGKQAGICFGKIYSAESELLMGDSVKLLVKYANIKFPCKIIVNENQLNGYLVKDTQKVNRGLSPNLYQFYILKQVYPSLFIGFYTEDGKSKARIINQDYLKIFKPGFDAKGIELTLNE